MNKNDKKIHIVFDTNILNGKSLNFFSDLRLKAIKLHAKNNLFVIHMPYMIYNELLSQIQNSSLENINGAKKYLKTLKKLEIDCIDIINDQLLNQENSIKEEISNKLNNWCTEAKVIQYKLNSNDTDKVFNAYFNGNAPFTKPKMRNDIPDSYIYENIKDISKQQQIIFISDDKTLRNSVSELNKNITAYKNLEEFFNDTSVKQILENHKIVEAISYLKKNNDKIKEYISHIAQDFLIDESFGCSNIVDDDPKIDSINEICNINLDFKDYQSLGEGHIIWKVKIKADVNASFLIYKADYYCSTYDFKNCFIFSDWNEHYYHCSADFIINIEISASLKLDLSATEIEDYIDFNCIEIESLDSALVAEN